MIRWCRPLVVWCYFEIAKKIGLVCLEHTDVNKSKFKIFRIVKGVLGFWGDRKSVV
jgi:hypothetical protein